MLDSRRRGAEAVAVLVPLLPACIVFSADLLVRLTQQDPLAVWGASFVLSDRKLQLALAGTLGLWGLGVLRRWGMPERRWVGAVPALAGCLCIASMALPSPSIVANRVHSARWEIAPPVSPLITPAVELLGPASRWETFASGTWAHWDGLAPSARRAFDLGTGVPEAVFALEVVMAGWAFGNPDGQGEGCVLRNALQRQPKRLRDLTPDDYVRSPIACCADYVTILAELLRRRGHRVAVVSIPGHWLVELSRPEGTLLLDPTTGLLREDRGERRRVLAWAPPGLVANAPFPRTALHWPRVRMEQVFAWESLALATRQHAVAGYEHLRWDAARDSLEGHPATR
jgi:hypothetical protein